MDLSDLPPEILDARDRVWVKAKVMGVGTDWWDERLLEKETCRQVRVLITAFTKKLNDPEWVQSWRDGYARHLEYEAKRSQRKAEWEAIKQSRYGARYHGHQSHRE